MASLTRHEDAARIALAKVWAALPETTGDNRRDWDRALNSAMMEAVIVTLAKGLDRDIERHDVAMCIANATANTLASAIGTLAPTPAQAVVLTEVLLADLGMLLRRRIAEAMSDRAPDGQVVTEPVDPLPTGGRA